VSVVAGWWEQKPIPADLVHRLAGQADIEEERVATLLDPDALGHRARRVGLLAVGLLDVGAGRGALRQVDQARAVERHHRLLGVIVQRLAQDEDRLAVAVAVRIREGDVRGQRDVAGDPGPEVEEFIPRVPDVVAGGGERVLVGHQVVARLARHERTADLGLALERPAADAAPEGLGPGRPVEVGRGRDLVVGGRAGQRPVRDRGHLRPAGEGRGQGQGMEERAAGSIHGADGRGG
jgi:hypothetical protein